MALGCGRLLPLPWPLSPSTRPVWLPSSGRSLLPEGRLAHPVLPTPCPANYRGSLKTRAQGVWSQYCPVTVWGRLWTSS